MLERDDEGAILLASRVGFVAQIKTRRCGNGENASRLAGHRPGFVVDYLSTG
jgi:hypothetical protein